MSNTVEYAGLDKYHPYTCNLHPRLFSLQQIIFYLALTIKSLLECMYYCKTRKFHLRLIFAISTDKANQLKLKASKNDI